MLFLVLLWHLNWWAWFFSSNFKPKTIHWTVDDVDWMELNEKESLQIWALIWKPLHRIVYSLFNQKFEVLNFPSRSIHWQMELKADDVIYCSGTREMWRASYSWWSVFVPFFQCIFIDFSSSLLSMVSICLAFSMFMYLCLQAFDEGVYTSFLCVDSSPSLHIMVHVYFYIDFSSSLRTMVTIFLNFQ